MRIDEFVNTYTPIELEKINERKSERNKPGRKALMGKVLDNIVGNKSANKEVSNNQAVKIIQEAFTSQTNFSKCIVAPRKTSANRVNRSRTLKD